MRGDCALYAAAMALRRSLSKMPPAALRFGGEYRLRGGDDDAPRQRPTRRRNAPVSAEFRLSTAREVAAHADGMPIYKARRDAGRASADRYGLRC